MSEKNTEHLSRNHGDLVRLARAFYESVLHEDNPVRLELHRKLAVTLADLINDTINNDGALDENLGLHLILFAEHKAEGSKESETMRQWALDSLENSETKIGLKD